ncbi:hypothetical protein JOF53_008166 [Crossiella equi]|uniref:Uncharacterized protein n=1 Tax=Crossiella equi TaxID=130796 RepID=A0ABS5ARU3_9PSEU|nr:DUF5994 family protein [Crossiella equi]MBP2479294.1 hypothetical protein [Crossiella equi]
MKSLVRRTPRLWLKPDASGPGRIDGAWWPLSKDLLAELPPLLPALVRRLGRVDRLIYHPANWLPAGNRLTVGAGAVLLSGLHSQPPDTVTVLGQGRRCLTLLVPPPETTPEFARATAPTITRRHHPTPFGDTATQRWEADGGSFR